MSAIVQENPRLHLADDRTVMTRSKGFGLLVYQDQRFLVETRRGPRKVGTAGTEYVQLPQSTYRPNDTPVLAARMYLSTTTPLRDVYELKVWEVGFELTVDTLPEVQHLLKGYSTLARDWLLLGSVEEKQPDAFPVEPDGKCFEWLTQEDILERCQPFRQDNYAKVFDYFESCLGAYVTEPQLN